MPHSLSAQQPSQRALGRWLVIASFVCCVGLVGLTGSVSVYAQDQTYTVQGGDTWSSVAARFGVSVAELQAANPQAIRSNRWLYRGETLTIPSQGESDTPATTTTSETQPTTYTVQAGDWWINIAERFGISVSELRAANPHLIRPGDLLYRGDQMTIPGGATTDSAAANSAVVVTGAATSITVQPTPTASVAPTVTVPVTPSAMVTTEASSAVTTTTATTVTATATTTRTAATAPAVSESVTATATLTTTAPATTTAEVTTAPDCPTEFDDYPAVLEERLNGADGVDGVTALLADCGAAVDEGLQRGDWTGDGQDDLLVIYADPQEADSTQPKHDLLVFDSAVNGYALGYRAKAAGKVQLLATEDINDDAQPDIAWTDETCGANTCFQTVEVISWTGAQWSDWTDGSISMAYAEVTLKDVNPESQGAEITLQGGVYGSAGAGPQRSRTEVWASDQGVPYALASKVYDASKCLYHTVLDANEAFLNAVTDGFGRAELLYTQAATDKKLEKCGERPDELDELRSFSLYRLALVAAYDGKAEVAGDIIASLSATYPDSAYDKLGQTWAAGYQETQDMGQTCRAVTQYASKNLDTVAVLADYGFANPTFTAEDICPVLAVEIPTASVPVTTTVTPTATAPLTMASEAITPAITTSSAITSTASAAITPTVPATLTVGLPACPADLSGYPKLLPDLLAEAGQDEVRIDAWLRQCNALSDDRGGFALVDANGDKQLDAIFWPTVISDLGFGPKGTQGDLLIYHAAADGGYKLVADEEIYGQPTLLAAEDLNADGKLDLAWQVVGCSTFCVLEAQIVTWDGSVYTSTIRPGATIAEGTASFTALDMGSTGKGKQLVLTGGVSGTPEGGLATPHTEVWQSIKGAPFQRVRWTYDRSAEGNDCLGLRLIEADVALQAARAIGYKPAVDLYTQAVNPTLKACSVYGMSTVDELTLLQGLASFRLIQAQMLSGNTQAGRSTLTSLVKGQPDSLYTQAANQWVTEYEKAQDAQAACAAVQPLFTKNEKLWQITDHFGYNHPPMAAEQICYLP